MHAGVKSVHGNYYCQGFGNKDFFVGGYTMDKKLDCNEALDKLVKNYCASD